MPDPRYLKWTDRWLITNDMINCAECHAAQFMVQRDSDFVHEPTCSQRRPGQRPYMELLEMLKAMQDELPLDCEESAEDPPSGEV